MKTRIIKPTKLPFPRITGRRYMRGGFKSIYLGCHPSQVEEFNRQMKHHGCEGVVYDPQGRAHVSSQADYTKVAESITTHYPPTHEVPEE